MDFENHLSPTFNLDFEIPLESQAGKQVVFSLMDWTYYKEWQNVINISPIDVGYIKYLGIYIWNSDQQKEFDEFIEDKRKDLRSKGIYFIIVTQKLLEDNLRALSQDFSH